VKRITQLRESTCGTWRDFDRTSSIALPECHTGLLHLQIRQWLAHLAENDFSCRRSAKGVRPVRISVKKTSRLRVSHRNTGTFSLRQADRQLLGLVPSEESVEIDAD